MSAKQNRIISFHLSPENMGLLDPATSDGRVIFFLPWEKMTIAGTTDTPTDVTHHPIPSEEDINFILNEVRNYLSSDVEGNINIPETFLPSLVFTTFSATCWAFLASSPKHNHTLYTITLSLFLPTPLLMSHSAVANLDPCKYQEVFPLLANTLSQQPHFFSFGWVSGWDRGKTGLYVFQDVLELYIVHGDLEFMIFLPLPLECWDYRCVSPPCLSLPSAGITSLNYRYISPCCCLSVGLTKIL
jgi:hypothetical protein